MSASENTVLDVIREVFGESASTRLADRIERRASWRLLVSFADRFERYYQEMRAPDKGSADLDGLDELRPYVPTQAIRAKVALGGIDLDFHHFLDRDTFAKTMPELVLAFRHYLLYCHSLAVDNPLAYFTDGLRPGAESSGQWARHALANYVRFASEVKPLIERRILILVEPFYRPSRPVITDESIRFGNAVEAEVRASGDFSDVQRAAGAQRAPSEHIVSTLVDDAIDALIFEMDAIQFHEQRLDFYVPFQYYVRVLRAFGRGLRAPEDQGRVVFSQLGTVAMPRLGDVTLGDLIAIRENEDAFESWRVDLRDVLATVVSNADAVVSGTESEVLVSVRERLASSRQHAEEKMSKSKFLGRAREGAKTVTLGAAAAAIATPLVGPAALAVPVAHLPVQLLWAVLTSRGKQAKTSRALARHYAIFSPEQAQHKH